MLIAIAALGVASLASGATAKAKGGTPDPPLSPTLSVHDPGTKDGLEVIRLLLLARSGTDMPVPGVKVYLRIYTHGDVHFLVGLGRKLGPNETLVKAKSVHNEWVWSMYSAPPNTGDPARLPLQVILNPLKYGQSINMTAWGRTIEGTKPTPQQSKTIGVS